MLSIAKPSGDAKVRGVVEVQEQRTPVTESDFAAGVSIVTHQPAAARVSNLSLSGVRLITSEPMRVGSRLSIRMRRGNDSLAITAIVRWVEAIDGSGWYAGCEFDGRIDEDFLTHVEDASAERGESSNCGRLLSSVPVTLRTEHDSDCETPGRVVNYSSGGICLSSTRRFNPGEAVGVEVAAADGNSETIFARVQWCRGETGEVIHGCRFPDRDDFVRFCKSADLQPLPEPSPAPVSNSSSPIRGMLLTATLLLLGCAALYVASRFGVPLPAIHR